MLRLVVFGTILSSASACSTQAWGQCGGGGPNNPWGPTCCPAGHECIKGNDWWSSCKPVVNPTPKPTSKPTQPPVPTPAPTTPPPTPKPTNKPTQPPVPTPAPTPNPTNAAGNVLTGNLMYASATGSRSTWTPTYITKDTFGQLREGSNDPNVERKRMTYYRGVDAASKNNARATGNCAYSNIANLNAFENVQGWVALSKAKRYEKSMSCGMCVEYRGLTHVHGGISNPIPQTWQKAMVVDACAGCEAGSKQMVELDLAASTGTGNWKIEWKSVECDVTGPSGSQKFQYAFEGSNTWAIKIQIRNTKVPIYKVEMKGRKNVLDVTHADAEYKYYEMRRSDDNFFRADSGNTPDMKLHWARPYGKYVGAVKGSSWGTYENSIELRITSIFGEQVEESVAFGSADGLKQLSYSTPITGTKQFDAGASFGAGRRLDGNELMAPNW